MLFRSWARGFRFQTAWLLAHVGNFASARALCEQERPLGEKVQMDQLLGSIVLGLAHLGSKRHTAALSAFQEVTAQSMLMRSILQMPLRLGLGQYWLARGQLGRAREQLEELCRLATSLASARTWRWAARGSPRRRLPSGTCPLPSASCPRRSTRLAEPRCPLRSGESARRPPGLN